MGGGFFSAVARGPVPRDAKCLKQDLQDLQDYLPRREHFFCNGCLFRSVRTCMSIEKQTCHRFQGPLGLNLNPAAAKRAIDIKDLKDLRHGEGQASAHPVGETSRSQQTFGNGCISEITDLDGV